MAHILTHYQFSIFSTFFASLIHFINCQNFNFQLKVYDASLNSLLPDVTKEILHISILKEIETFTKRKETYPSQLFNLFYLMLNCLNRVTLNFYVSDCFFNLLFKKTSLVQLSNSSLKSCFNFSMRQKYFLGKL